MEGNMLIGEVCREADCTARTVRHYEAEGLFSPVAKTSGGRKLYGKEAVSIIRTARLLKRLGYSLREIRHIISLTKSRDTRNRRLTIKLRNLLSETISSIDHELELLSTYRKKLSDVFEQTLVCEGCASADCKDCGKLESIRKLGMLAEPLR
jgi:DNA-binding transcriptional MerR regulator